MSSIDERIVNMQFNNRQFESGIQTSLRSLDKLEKGLQLDGATKSLMNLDKAGRSFSLAGISAGVEAMSSRFSALGIMGATVLQNLTNTALNAGKKIASALTIDPIKTGFQEYETQINAVQTILANTSAKGTTLTQVNDALDQLNTYADKTIYNFTEMTRNIGTFTAAGVDLDTSVSAIKGIANLAAVSGSTSQQASTAMYQFSQALASGTVKLMDWNSVVNAGMGGQVFQDALKETARVHGVAIDSMIKSDGSFRETLQRGWLTSSILTETLNKFTGDLNAEQLKTMGYTNEQITSILKMGQTANDAATKVKTFTQLWDTLKEAAQSGWSQSWEIIVGDFEEAKLLLTQISDTLGAMIGASAAARIELLQGWKDLGGRATLIEAAKNAFEGILSVIAPIKAAFTDIFPPMTAVQLNNLTVSLKNFTEYLKLGAGPAEELRRAFKGVFAIFGIGWEAVKAVAGAFKEVFLYIAPASSGILSFSATLGDWLVSVHAAVKAGDAFSTAFDKIGSVVRPVADGIKAVFTVIFELIKSFATANLSGIDALGDRLKERLKPFDELGAFISGGVDKIGEALKSAITFFASIGSRVGDALSGISSGMGEVNFSSIVDAINTGLMGGLIFTIKKFVDSLGDVTSSADDFLGSIKGILDGVRGSLTAWQTSIKANTLFKIAGAVAILAGSLFLLATIGSDKLFGALTAITVLFVELFASMVAFEKIVNGPGFLAMAKITATMIAMSVAVLILSAAVKNLASQDWESLSRGLVGVAALSATLVISAKSLSKSSGPLIKGSLGLIVFATAIGILADSVEQLGGMDAASLTKGLIGVGVLCAELVLFLKTSDLSGMSLIKSVGFIALATAIRILANSVSIFGALDLASLSKGLFAVGVVLAELAIFTKTTGNSSKVVSTAAGMILLGAAVNIFAIAIERIGNMSIEEIGKGLLGMAGALLAVTLALNFMPKNMVATSLGLIGVATAVTIIAGALATLGGMTWEQVAVGLVALAGSLTILTIATNALTGALPGAAALLVISAALAVLTPAIRSLGEMSLTEIGMALLTLVGVFATLGLAALALAPVTPALLALAGAVALFGVATLAVGAGVLLFATGLSALAVAGTGAAAALVLMVSSVIGLIPMVIEQIGRGLILFAQVIVDGGPLILKAIEVVLVALLDAIIAVIPKLVDAVVIVITRLLQTLADYTEPIIQAAVDILVALIKALADNIGPIVEVAVDLVAKFVLALAEQTGVLVAAAFEMIITLIDGLGAAIEEQTPRLLKSVAGLAVSIVKGLANGIIGGVGEIGKAVISLGSTALDKLKGFLGINSPSKAFQKLGQYTSDGFVLGVRDKFGDAKKVSTDLGSTILTSLKGFLGIQSPSRVMRDEVGRYIVLGIAEGITNDMSAEEAATKKAQNIVAAFKAELDRIDLNMSTSDLEYSLWEKLSGLSATGPEKAAMQLQNISSRYSNQAEKARLAQAEYQTTVKALGKDSADAQQAYNKYLQAQIDLASTAQELSEAQRAQGQSQKAAERAYYAELQENTEFLSKMGFSMEEIEADARKRSGYNPEAMTSAMGLDVKDAVTSALGNVQTVYQDQSQIAFKDLTQNFSQLEGAYSKAIGDGVKEGSTKILNNTKAALKACTDAIAAEKPKWTDLAKTLVNAFIEGIRANVEAAARAAAEMAAAAYKAAMAAINAEAPDYSPVADTMDEVAGRVDKIVKDTSGSPTITPVLNLDAVKAGAKTIGNLLTGNVLGLASSAGQLAAASGLFNKTSTKTQASAAPTQTFNFQQTNNSPKALSRTEIYRQTNNQFSALKQVVTKK